MIRQKGDSLQAACLLVASLLVGCAHEKKISTTERAELTAMACDAERVCQAHGNLSDENFPLMPQNDAACVNLARRWLQAAGAACTGASK